MAEQPCVTYLDFDAINNAPPMMTTIYDNIYLQSQVPYPPAKARSKRQEKTSNNPAMRRPRRMRTVFSEEQTNELKYYFMQCQYIKQDKAQQIATKFSMPVNVIKVWFKNKRSKLRTKEVEHRKLIQHPQEQIQPNLVPELPSSMATPSPSPSPSISPVEMILPYESMYPGVKQEIFYNSYNDQAYQWLRNLPSLTPAQMVYNSASPHHIPQRQSLHDNVFKFNHLPYYTLPSPALSSISGDSNHMTVNSDTSDYFSQMSPNSELNEPLTPQSTHGEVESVFNGILDGLKTAETDHSIETIFADLTKAPEPEVKTEQISS